MNTFSDPLEQLLKERGVAPAIWRFGSTTGENSQSKFQLGANLHFGHFVMLDSRTRLPDEPAWFRQFARWTAAQNFTAFDWQYFAHLIRRVEAAAQYYASLFHRSAASVVIVQGFARGFWHAPLCLAANRAGVKLVGIQEGVFEEEELPFCTARHPVEGQIGPDSYWLWSHRDRARFQSSVKESDCIHVVGNLWHRYWGQRYIREADDTIGSDPRKAILLTTQSSVDYSELVSAALALNGDAVRWIIRMHPRASARERQEIVEAFEGVSNIVVVDGEDCSLFACLESATVHVTAYSTCAREALLFGVPSVILSRDRGSLFQQFIDRGAMELSCDSAGIEQAIRKFLGTTRSGCQEIMRDHGAGGSDAEIDAAVAAVFGNGVCG